MAVLDEAFTDELGEGLEAVLGAWESEGPISRYDRCRVVVDREPLEAGDGGEMRCRRTSTGSALGFGGVLGFSSEQRLRLNLQGIRGASARLLPVEPPGPSSGVVVLDRHAVFIWDTDASELQLDGWTQDSQQTEPRPTYEIQTEPLGDPCGASVMDVTGVEAVSYGDIRTGRAATDPSTPSAVLAFTSETARSLWVTRREGASAFLCPDSCDVADCQEITDAWLDEPRFEPLAAGATHRILLFANDATTRVGFELKLLAAE